jgi:hypothetical protein
MVLVLSGIHADYHGEEVMAAVVQHSVQELDAQEGRQLLDRQARRYLGMSAEEFAEAWDRGADVARVAMLLPFGR